MPTTLITGCNRGLGLEFVRQYADAGWRVHATCREPEQADALRSTAREHHGSVVVHRLDVTSAEQTRDVATALGDEAIDLLICNAGVHGDRLGFGQTDYRAWAAMHAVNTMAPLRLVEALVESVAASEQKRIAVLTSIIGGLARNTRGARYLYGSTKAGANYVVRSLAADLRSRGVTVVAIHPGWVATDMGGGEAPLPTDVSVASLRELFAGLPEHASGEFIQYDGERLPW